MTKIITWIVIVTFALGTLGWLLFTELGLRTWLMWELFVFCVAVLANAASIKSALGRPKKRKR